MLINDELQRQVLPVLARATVVPTAEVQQRAGSLLQLSAGQQVKAEIMANLPNNLYLARIAGEMFKLEIPLNVPPGATLEMTCLAADPRIIFQLARPEGRESVSLSSMGRWLAAVAQDAPPLAAEPGALVEHPGEATALLGERLKSALVHSGIFYEAHLAQWALGNLPLAELFKEPQGKLSRAARHSKEGEGAQEGEPETVDGYADSRTLPLVKEQLQLLNSGILSWKGEAWPGQGMELAVTARDAELEGREVEATLSLELPRLGSVQARMCLGPGGFSLEFECAASETSAVLREAGGRLRAALAVAGVPLIRMAVRDVEPAQ